MEGQLESRLEQYYSGTYTATLVGFLCKCGKMRLSPRAELLYLRVRPRLRCDLISHFVSAHHHYHSAI